MAEGASQDDSQNDGPFWTNEGEYDGPFFDHLLQQHQSYVEMATRTSDRRVRTNRLYITVLSVLVVSVSFVPRVSTGNELTRTVIFAVLVFGILLCGIWYSHIQSYSKLNSEKYRQIWEVERRLPYSYYEAEWKSDRLKEGNSRWQYIPHASVEQFIPLALSLPYLLLLGQLSLSYIPYMGIERTAILVLGISLLVSLIGHALR